MASIRDEITSILARDPAARSRLEVALTYPGLHAVMLHRVAHRLWRRNWKLLAKLIATFARVQTGIEIHPAAQIGDFLFIDHGMGTVIGETAMIGNRVTLYHDVTLGGTSMAKVKRHPTLEDDVVVGAGAQVLGPITVGKGARVGANAVVVKDVPAGATVVGIPAREVIGGGEFGFSAYGLAAESNDPAQMEFDALKQRFDELERKVRNQGEAEGSGI